MQQIIPFLWFDTQAEEAMNFYVSIFKNLKGHSVNRQGGKAFTVSFSLNGQEFAAINGGSMYQSTEGISFVVNCADQAEIDYYWARPTADGGQESMCGWLKDKYGISWQIIPAQMNELMGSSPEGASKVDIAFQASDRECVARFCSASLEAGGIDNGQPGERQCHPRYYAAYVLDPDGNNIEAVFHGPVDRSANAVILTPVG